MKIIKQVPIPKVHRCQKPSIAELPYLDLYTGSIIECKCGERYILVYYSDHGYDWVKLQTR